MFIQPPRPIVVGRAHAEADHLAPSLAGEFLGGLENLSPNAVRTHLLPYEEVFNIGAVTRAVSHDRCVFGAVPLEQRVSNGQLVVPGDKITRRACLLTA